MAAASDWCRTFFLQHGMSRHGQRLHPFQKAEALVNWHYSTLPHVQQPSRRVPSWKSACMAGEGSCQAAEDAMVWVIDRKNFKDSHCL